MDIAIVTGAESLLGLRIVKSLIQQGCRVHGIGNNFSKVTYDDPQFKAHAIDLTDLESSAATLGKILEEEGRLHLLVHAIDVTPGAAFEKLPVGNLEAILKVGLLGPVMMTRLALPNLLRFRGQLINVIPANKFAQPASALNALIEGGLREMNRALFDQGRDSGLRITNCILRQNNKLPGARVSDDVLEQNHIDFDDVARCVEQLVDPKAVNVPAEIVLYPKLSPSAEEALPDSPLPLDAYSGVVLPPKEYCPPQQPKIPTEKKQQIERTIPYTDEEMEDKIAAAIEDFEANPERFEQPDPKPKQNPRPSGQSGQEPQEQQGQQGQGKNKRRRRRRGGRNRNKKPQEGEMPKTDKPAQPQPQQEKPSESKSDNQSEKEPVRKPVKKRTKKSDKKSTDQQGSPSDQDQKKTTKKAAKKSAKKAVKKAVKKKAAKEAAKKTSSKLPDKE